MDFRGIVRLLLMFCSVAVLFPQGAHALEQQMHTATMGLEGQYHHFKSDEMKENGLLFGLNGAYTYRGRLISEKHFPQGMAKVEGHIIFGRVNFDGKLFDGNHYDIKKVKDFSGEVRGLLGYDFTVFSATTITPFAGLGYRFYKDNLSKDNAGYRRVSHYLYTPLGVETRTPFANNWSAGIAVEYDFFWTGRQDTSLSDLDSLFSDLENDLSDGYGIRGSIKLRKELEDKNFVFEPYVNYWKIDNSDIVKVYHTGVFGGLTFQEPENSTIEIGMKVSVEF